MKKQLAACTGALALTATLVTAASTAQGSAQDSSPRRTTVTETFTSQTLRSVPLSKTSSIDLARDVKDGKVIGADTTVARFHPATGLVTGEFSFARKDGLLTGTFTLDTHTLDITGTIDGGEGAYRGATGTATGHAIDRKTTEVTLVYRR